MGLVSSTVPRGSGAVRIGCSGWQYTHCRGEFYPAGLAQARGFAHDALHFDTVEINRTGLPLERFEIFLRALAPTWGRAVADVGTDVGTDVVVFAYFNNDVKGHAPRDAVQLRRQMQKRMAA